MKQSIYRAHLLKYKTGFKAVVKLDEMTHTAQWYKTEAEAVRDTERFAFRHWNCAKLQWLPTINKIRKSNRGIDGK